MTSFLTKKGAIKTVEILNNSHFNQEMLQINVMQITMVCLSPVRFTMAQTFVDNVLSILLNMYEAKSKTVMSTAKAALNQLFSHVINDLVRCKNSINNEEDVDSDEEVKGNVSGKMDKINKANESEQSLSICSKLLTGLVSHLNPEKETLWPVPVNNSTTALALDLLAIIISEGKHELAKFKQIMVILDQVFDPLLNQMTSMKSNYAISIRLIN